MHRVLTLIAAGSLTLAVFPTTASGQQPTVERAFEHYERIRTSLAQDTTKSVRAEASALVPLARELAGEQAARAAEVLAKATDLEQARDRFGTLSETMVPKFLEARLPGGQGYVCSMKQKRWAQRGDTAANPYYGKAMATCGTPIKTPPAR
jgi:hypothetical protein